MPTLFRYSLTSLLRVFLVFTAVLGGVVWLSQSMRILSLIINQGISLVDFLKVAGLMIPSLLFFLIPITFLLTVVFLVYLMRKDKEIITLKSIGLSDAQIVYPVIVIGLIIAFCDLVNATYVMPKSHARFKDLNEYFQNQYATLLLQEKTFNSQGKLTVYFDSKSKDGQLKGLFISDARDPQKTRIISAANGTVSISSGGPIFELENGTQQETDIPTGKLSILSFDKYVFNLKKITSSASNRNRSPVEMTITEIINNIPNDQKEQANYFSIISQRISWPIFSISLPLLAAVLLVKAEYNRQLQILKFIKVLGLCGGFMVLATITINMINTAIWWVLPLITINVMPFFISYKQLTAKVDNC